MITWILILTMWSSDSKFMLQIPGFATQQKCAIAADQWIKQNDFNNGWHRNNAVCVQL